ncbi:hypothetical protein YC2023_089054 [Brassica napus]
MLGKRICIRVRRVCTMVDDGCATSIDKASLASIDRHFTVSIDIASTKSSIPFFLVKYCPYGLFPHQS